MKTLPGDDNAPHLIDEKLVVLARASVEPLQKELQDGLGVVNVVGSRLENLKKTNANSCMKSLFLAFLPSKYHKYNNVMGADLLNY